MLCGLTDRADLTMIRYNGKRPPKTVLRRNAAPGIQAVKLGIILKPIASVSLRFTHCRMTSATTPTLTVFPRRWLWPFAFLTAGLMVTAPFAPIFAGIVYFAVTFQGGSSFVEVAVAIGAAIMACLWMWLAWFTTKLFMHRKSPLLRISDDGIEIPHRRPHFIPWDQIASVDQTESGRVTYLRLRLVSPNELLTCWQRRVRWPLSDSVLITLDMDRSLEANPAFVAVKARHAEHSKVKTDGLDASA